MSAQSVSRGDAEDPRQEPTGLPLTTLQRVGTAICNLPDGFNPHPDVSDVSLGLLNLLVLHADVSVMYLAYKCMLVSHCPSICPATSATFSCCCIGWCSSSVIILAGSTAVAALTCLTVVNVGELATLRSVPCWQSDKPWWLMPTAELTGLWLNS